MLDAIDPTIARARFGVPDAHAVRVATLAADLARRLGFSRRDIDTIVEGALLHDLGKTRVPKTILDQRRPLTEDEYATVMQHPEWGAELVEGYVAEGVLLAIRHHHEWWNGKGYPAQLSAHDIPIEARIVGIADAFAAMREERPYRPARTRYAAVGELRQCAGTQFDPQLVEPLIAGVVAEDCPPLRLAAH
jgi:putative nucleotidyltransferase with HDIG domain